ncbi:nuclear factor NF-kappa-B p100 subunit-like [Stegodyphus dumicola]|uniref:nuclear factor NF-kappa-B p100 subunit-like n=1 Tax=Stegodyphus dumicola TaxID=202533 RepID=UPI0015A814EA|nr:nuclear factor NF-kappa-B p100 subunit-like [Stegodyphus dumicola]XP_035222637.1 nuclear factor NF-kappa-B p100 subunit-like [Stegodyphus dumicola]XP_035222638.1 nuclear factor NF-kappa-B p100 subunit-like [Stegodyphus dumicola]XP_035222639.1 nuclear factor NF-kappa-B p100 subunit-like [Stegodyphus dumicola]XP_035222641.1 nuclear factor NF-kappa-B p100 subunit-like [Stegodyphus dumicola]
MLSESFYLPSYYNEALQLGTYIQEDISLSTVNDVYSPNSPEGAINFLDLPLNRSHYSGMPYLNLIVQPAEMYRFRYESEKGSHGSLGGKGITNSKKSCPTVKLENYENKRNVLIRVSLYTKEEIPRPHVLQLKKKNSVTDDAVYEKLGKDFTAKFQSLCIVNKRKEEIVGILKNRKLKELYPRGSGIYTSALWLVDLYIIE